MGRHEGGAAVESEREGVRCDRDGGIVSLSRFLANDHKRVCCILSAAISV